MLQQIRQQLERPSGLLGHLAGLFLAWENDDRTAWAMKQLKIRQHDHVLEIGFGPGDCLREVAEGAKRGFVAGVELSDVMIEQAHSRNAQFIEAGQMELRQGDVMNLPFEDRRFDKVFTINSINLWPDEAVGLREIKRTLKPGGIVAIIEQPPSRINERAEIKARGEAIMQSLRRARFKHIRAVHSNLPNGMAVCVLAKK
jgi:SAM-dependent methyltransferase